MENATKIDQLMAALFALHKQFGVTISKDRRGNRGTYASLPCVLESLHDMCHPHNLILSQASCIIEGKCSLLTTLYHLPSGQSISSVSLLTPNPEAASHDQAWGGSSTYHRRYDAMMLMGIFSEDDPTDHDGNHSPTKTTTTTATTNTPGRINEKQLGLLKARLNGDKKTEDAILAKLGISHLSDIPWQKFNDIIKYLEIPR